MVAIPLSVLIMASPTTGSAVAQSAAASVPLSAEQSPAVGTLDPTAQAPNGEVALGYQEFGYYWRWTTGNFSDYRNPHFIDTHTGEYIDMVLNNRVGYAKNNGYPCSGCDRVEIFSGVHYSGTRLALIHRGQDAGPEALDNRGYTWGASSHRWN